MTGLLLWSGLALGAVPEAGPEPVPVARSPVLHGTCRRFELVSLGTLAVGVGFFTYGVTRAGQNSGNASLQYLAIGAAGGGVALLGLGLGWVSTALAASRLRQDGALARRWAVAGSVVSGVLAVGLGATRNTLPWTDQGQIWVNQAFPVAVLTTGALLGIQLGLNELAWWDHKPAVGVTPWWSPESRGVALVATF